MLQASRDVQAQQGLDVVVYCAGYYQPLRATDYAVETMLRHQEVNYIGAARGIARGNARTYALCGCYGAVLCGNEDIDFLHAGRAIERAWLTATAAGLSFHLQTGVNFLWQRIHWGGDNTLSMKHRKVVEDAYGEIQRIFDAQGMLVPALFRIGRDGAPSAWSSKKKPEVIFQ